VAAVFPGKTGHPGIALTLTPGSRQILDTRVASTYRDLIAAGARMLEPACGPCAGMNQAPATGTISGRTFNPSFPGCSGTENGHV
jgi:aconitate hydratase